MEGCGAEAGPIQGFRRNEPHEPLERTGQGSHELARAYRVMLQPEALHHQGLGGALPVEIGAGDQPILLEDGQRVVAPPPLLWGFVDLPEILKVEQGQGAPTGAHIFQRRQEDHLLFR
jgi:hypothetical protein